MNLILSTMLLFSVLPNDSTDFYDKVTGDFARSSYYLSFVVQFSDYKGRVIIENDDMYSFFNADDTLTRDEYKIIINKMLTEQRFDFSNRKISHRGFVKVVYRDNVAKAAAKGKANFLNTFFNRNVLKSTVDPVDHAAIIEKLFRWGVLARYEDESGLLVIRLF